MPVPLSEEKAACQERAPLLAGAEQPPRPAGPRQRPGGPALDVAVAAFIAATLLAGCAAGAAAVCLARGAITMCVVAGGGAVAAFGGAVVACAVAAALVARREALAEQTTGAARAHAEL